MNEELFRKKSLDKVKSPECLDDYIRVSNPGVWLLLISVIVLLAGACVWGVFGRIDSTVPTTVRVENGVPVCLVGEEKIVSVRAGMTVRYGGAQAVIAGIGEKDGASYLCTLTADSCPADGFYEGQIVVETVSPLSFVLN